MTDWRTHLKAVIVGAVESTRVALDVIAREPGWTLSLVLTLPRDLARRHDDFVDLAKPAMEAGAEVQYVKNVNSDEALDTLRSVRADAVFVIGWSQICGEQFQTAAGGRVIGYHPAPLPRLRGRAVIPWTILNAEPITAGTLFWIDSGVDSGPILAQRFFHVADNETAASLYAKHMVALRTMMEQALPQIAAGNPPRVEQDEQYATWAARRTMADGIIDWSLPAAEIETLIRAVGKPYAGASTFSGPARLTIWRASAGAFSRHSAASGQVVSVEAAGFCVMCGNGQVLHIHEFASDAGEPPRMHSRLTPCPMIPPSRISGVKSQLEGEGKLHHA